LNDALSKLIFLIHLQTILMEGVSKFTFEAVSFCGHLKKTKNPTLLTFPSTIII